VFVCALCVCVYGHVPEEHVPHVASAVTSVGKKVSSPSRSPANAAPASSCAGGDAFRSLAQAIGTAAGSFVAPSKWPSSPYTCVPTRKFVA
jgi:hypothetical protein